MASLKNPVPMKKQGKNEEEFEKVVSAVEDENVRQLDGDTEVGEDGCVHDVPLLAGYVDDEGNLHKTFSYREMTTARGPPLSSSPHMLWW